MEAREKAVRERAEKTLFEKVGFMKRRKLKKILKKARFHIKKREELRFMRTKYAGVVRSLVYRFGKNFEKSGLIDDFKDICFFTINEIFELIQGRSANRSFVKELVAMRKKDYEDNKNNEPHERMYYYGDIYEDKFVEILSDAELEPEEETGDANTFKGTPCSPGQIEGIAKVVLTAEDASLNGEILVTKRTDPGWVPLFPSISGLVIERGSVLSHSAVVAREMGIPTIVGLRKITERIQTDDRVRVDGSNGLVSRLKK
jgi:pyruvate,water dikinase